MKFLITLFCAIAVMGLFLLSLGGDHFIRAVTLTTDTTGFTSAKSKLILRNWNGVMNASILVDSTGTTVTGGGASDSLGLFYKMLRIDYDGNISQIHDDWILAEIYDGSDWLTYINFADSVKYLVDFSSLDVCDACSLYITFGSTDSLTSSAYLTVYYEK